MQTSRRIIYTLVHFIPKIDSQGRSRVDDSLSSAQHSIEGPRAAVSTSRYSCSDNSAERKKRHGTEHCVVVKKQGEKPGGVEARANGESV